jgi:hypothetical protein
MPTRRVTIERNDTGRAQANDVVFNQILSVPGMKVISDTTIPDPTTEQYIITVTAQGEPNVPLAQVQAAVAQLVPDALKVDVKWRQPGS